MYVSGVEPSLSQCADMGQFPDTGWTSQCPVTGYGQWNVQPPDVCYGVYRPSFSEQPVQCHRDFYNNGQEYAPQQYHCPVQLVPSRQPMIPNLPCQQTPQWNYNSMCYDIEGGPCQYTNVVDLEDFM